MANLKIGIVGFGYWGKIKHEYLMSSGVLEGIYEKNLSLSKGYKKKYKFFSVIQTIINVCRRCCYLHTCKNSF